MILVFLPHCPHKEICKKEFSWIFFHSYKYLQYFSAFGNYMSTYQWHFCILKILYISWGFSLCYIIIWDHHTWNLLLELNGISATFLLCFLNSATFPTDSSANFSKADSVASPTHSLLSEKKKYIIRLE